MTEQELAKYLVDESMRESGLEIACSLRRVDLRAVQYHDLNMYRMVLDGVDGDGPALEIKMRQPKSKAKKDKKTHRDMCTDLLEDEPPQPKQRASASGPQPSGPSGDLSKAESAVVAAWCSHPFHVLCLDFSRCLHHLGSSWSVPR